MDRVGGLLVDHLQIALPHVAANKLQVLGTILTQKPSELVDHGTLAIGPWNLFDTNTAVGTIHATHELDEYNRHAPH